VDWFHAVLGYGRVRVILAASMLAAAPAPRFLVRGTGASLTRQGWDQQEESLARGVPPGSPGWGRDAEPLVIHGGDGKTREVVAPPGDYPAYYARLRDAIVGGGAPPVTAAQGCAVMAVLEAGERSSAEGRSVPPDLAEPERHAWQPEFESKNRSAASAAGR
jgi:predicted dehydrogenase